MSNYILYAVIHQLDELCRIYYSWHSYYMGDIFLNSDLLLEAHRAVLSKAQQAIYPEL